MSIVHMAHVPAHPCRKQEKAAVPSKDMNKKITPSQIRLEASSHCQLRCPSCPTTTGDIDQAVGKGYLKPEQFKKLIESSPFLKHVELSNYGEIFLNPGLIEIMAFAHEKGITLSAANGVNLNQISDDQCEALVKYQVRVLTCSIDGASQKTYEKYRVKGDFDKVIANIKKINTFKEKYQSKFPELVWQFIIFQHNEEEILTAKRMAADLKMGFRTKLSWDGGLNDFIDPEKVKADSQHPFASRAEYKEKTGRVYLEEICKELWGLPQVNWDGKILGCCRNFWGDFGGNAFEDGLEASLNNDKISYARDMLLGVKPPREGIPCTTCDIYRDRYKNKRFLKIRPQPVQKVQKQKIPGYTVRLTHNKVRP